MGSADRALLAQQGFQPDDFARLEWDSKDGRALKGVFPNMSGVSQADLKTESQWTDWLGQHIPPGEEFKRGVVAVLGGCASVGSVIYNPKQLLYLPWSQETFKQIMRYMKIDGSIVRTIYDGHVPVFRRIHIKQEGERLPAIAYNCRTVNSWPGDMAVSVTYIVPTCSTYAVAYGCSPGDMDRITKFFSAARNSICHPLFLPIILVELEQKRHFDLVSEGLVQRRQFVTDLMKNKKYDWTLREEDEEDRSTSQSVDLWMKICHLRNRLKGWRDQLFVLKGHIDELSETQFTDKIPGKMEDADLLFRQSMREAGNFMSDRLKDIAREYEVKISECNMIMDGMNMATQLAHTKANMEIAISTKRDSSRMKTIAVVTMIYLPSTYVATVFSTSFFDWKPDDNSGPMSPWFWVYFVASLGLTLLTFGLWHVCTDSNRVKLKASKVSMAV